jgi:hypothetical protein
MSKFSHYDYFRKYKLNVEQYGEILVAQAFKGKKKGDAQHGYDILIDKASKVISKLQDTVTGKKKIKSFFPYPNKLVRIEVKSKLSITNAGKASVVHCSKTKLADKRAKEGMTHLAIVIVQPGSRTEGKGKKAVGKEGVVERAWLITRDVADRLQKGTPRKDHIRLTSKKPSLKSVEQEGTERLDIKKLLQNAADARIGCAGHKSKRQSTGQRTSSAFVVCSPEVRATRTDS